VYFVVVLSEFQTYVKSDKKIFIGQYFMQWRENLAVYTFATFRGALYISHLRRDSVILFLNRIID